MVNVVTLISQPTNGRLAAAHSFYTFQVFCFPEFWFWVNQGFRVQVRHLNRGRDIQFVTGSVEHFLRVCNEDHDLGDVEQNELVKVQLATIKRILGGPTRPEQIAISDKSFKTDK